MIRLSCIALLAPLSFRSMIEPPGRYADYGPGRFTSMRYDCFFAVIVLTALRFPISMFKSYNRMSFSILSF